MKRLERRVEREFLYEGLGFPVVLLDVPMVKVRGQWTPDVDYDAVTRAVLQALASKPSRLRGSELRFIRHSLSMTLERFAQRFHVTHPAVIKWEKAGQRATSMKWSIEKDIRLETLRTASAATPARFLELYSALVHEPTRKPERLRVKVA